MTTSTNNKDSALRSRISAFMDGELAESDLEQVLQDLKTEEGQAIWAAYHETAELLRTPQAQVTFSPGFSARMAARLQQEPTVLAPAPGERRKRNAGWTSLSIPLAAAASVAIVSFMLTMPGSVPSLPHGSSMQVAAAPAPISAFSQTHASVMAKGEAKRAQALSELDYVGAHRRHSPSAYSTAHFARSSDLGSGHPD